jgi:hypothetical protein
VNLVLNPKTKKFDWLDPDKMKIEYFELAENLMLVGAVEASESAIVVCNLTETN